MVRLSPTSSLSFTTYCLTVSLNPAKPLPPTTISLSSNQRPTATHVFHHDIESFLWLFLWILSYRVDGLWHVYPEETGTPFEGPGGTHFGRARFWETLTLFEGLKVTPPPDEDWLPPTGPAPWTGSKHCPMTTGHCQAHWLQSGTFIEWYYTPPLSLIPLHRHPRR